MVSEQYPLRYLEFLATAFEPLSHFADGAGVIGHRNTS